jgi:hypothetical protein
MADNGHGDSDVWKIDKRVSVGNLIVLVAYGASSIWFMATTNARQDGEESDIKDNKTSIEQIQAANINVAERLAKLEVRVDVLATTINRIDRKLPTFKELEQQDQDK